LSFHNHKRLWHYLQKHLKKRRPIGLYEGEFLVPDDFNDPLPEEIETSFSGLFRASPNKSKSATI